MATTFRITFYPSPQYKDDLIGALKEAQKTFEQPVLGFNVETKLNLDGKDITIDIIYPISISEKIFKYVAMRQLKSKVKKIDKNCKVEYKKIKDDIDNKKKEEAK